MKPRHLHFSLAHSLPPVGEARLTLDHVGSDANLLAVVPELHGCELQNTHHAGSGGDRRDGLRQRTVVADQEPNLVALVHSLRVDRLGSIFTWNVSFNKLKKNAITTVTFQLTPYVLTYSPSLCPYTSLEAQSFSDFRTCPLVSAPCGAKIASGSA